MEPKSAFAEVFGDAPMIRLLDFLLDEGRYFDYSLTDVAKHSGVSWSTLHEIWPKLVKLGIVVQTRQIARAKLFKLNAENPLVKELVGIDLRLSKHFIERELQSQKVAIKVR
jgi:DNA-binding transcriptional ArsR family regulator